MSALLALTVALAPLAADSRPLLAEAGAGVVALPADAPPLFALNGGVEIPVFRSGRFFGAVPVRADWKHLGARGPLTGSFDFFAAVSGLRLGLSLGSSFELYAGAEAGPAAGFTSFELSPGQWETTAHLGVAWRASLGARLLVGSRLTVFLQPEFAGEAMVSTDQAAAGAVLVFLGGTAGVGLRL